MDLNDFRLDFVKKFDVTTIRSDDPDLTKTFLQGPLEPS